METKAGQPGAFARFDLGRVNTPAFVVDQIKIERNLAILRDVADRSGAKILGALKAFSMWSLAPTLMQSLDGTCASGLWEARLAREKYGKEVATYCAAYKESELLEIIELSDHVIFNSTKQLVRFEHVVGEAMLANHHLDIGLRINPMHSEGEVEKYDPCQPFSRLGTPIDQLTEDVFDQVSGLHLHTLCEQDFPPLERTWKAIADQVSPYCDRLKWLNFGGGHHITRDDYQREDLVKFLIAVGEETGLQIYLEPGEAIALDAGILVGEILDVFDNEMPVAITDVSATCHMPDVIEAPYRPAMLDEGGNTVVRLGGASCLAGDIIGDYAFDGRPQPGQRFAFLDQAHYSMVKTNSFNDVPRPSIWLWDSETDNLEQLKQFAYEDFRDQLS